MNKYYTPKPKKKHICLKCQVIFLGNHAKKFCSFKCKNSFNEKKIRERFFVHSYYKEIVKILGKQCVKCNKPLVHIHHKIYNIPVRKNKMKKEDIKKMLIEYCKFLEPLCFSCHQKEHLI